MSLWLAYAVNLVAVFLVYRGFFQFLRFLYRKNVFWAAALVIFLSPFVYVLFHVSSFMELMWVLLLTPFYGVAVMMALFTSWMIRYYCTVCCILAAMHYLLTRKRVNLWIAEDSQNRSVFWDVMGKAPAQATTTRAKVIRRIVQARQFLFKRARKHWNLFLIAVLIATVTTTLVEGPRANGSYRDPTYEEVLRFVVADQTNTNRYAENNSACAEFAEDFKSNALKAGYNCGYVVVYFPDSGSHALNAFKTVDRGLVFIEPQSDQIVTLTVGQPYWDRAKYEPPTYDDTVTGYRIVW